MSGRVANVRARSFGVVMLLLAGSACRPQRNQWVLKEYDRHKGYTFEHDGLVYHARCFATGRPVLPGGKPDLDPGAMPPNLVLSAEPLLSQDQSACQDVLPYLGKPVPSLTQPYPSILLYIGKDNWRLEFLIEDAK